MNTKSVSVFKVTLKGWFRSRTGIFFSFVFPFMLLLIFGFIFGGSGSSSYGIYVQNQDADNGTATGLSSSFIDALNSTNALRISIIPSNVDAVAYAKNYTSQLSRYRILIIPEGFANGTMSSASVIRMNITYYTMNYILSQFINYLPQNQTQYIQQGMSMFQGYVANSTVSYVNMTYIYDPTDQGALITRSIIGSVATAFNYGLVGATEIINFNDQTYAAKSLKAADYFMPGYIAAFIMTNGVIALTSQITDLKRRKVIMRLLSTPLKKSDWILGNISTQVVLGLMLTIFMMVSGYLIFGTVAAFDLLAFAIIITGIVAFSGLGMILGGLVKNVEASSALGNAIAFPMMFLSGTFFVLDSIPPFLQAISKVLPLTYFSDALRAVMIFRDYDSAIINLGILAAWAAVFIAVGIVVVRWKES